MQHTKHCINLFFFGELLKKIENESCVQKHVGENMRHIHLCEVNYKALELFHTDDCFIPHTLLFLKKKFLFSTSSSSGSTFSNQHDLHLNEVSNFIQ